MKKKRKFGLLTKIVLLTGLLTILTVATSFTVNSLISFNNTRKANIDSCDVLTKSVESVYSEKKDDTATILNTIIDAYEVVRDDYDNLTVEQVTKYQEDLRIDLFGPPDGSGFGMSLDKALRKSFIGDTIAKMQFYCSSYRVPYAEIFLYDIEKDCSINVTDSTLSLDDNLAVLGYKGPNDYIVETRFIENGLSYLTFIRQNTVYSYREVDVPLNNSNYRCYAQGQFSLAEFNRSFSRTLLTELLIILGSAIFLVIIYAVFTKLFLIRNVDRLIESTDKFVGMMKNDEPLEIVDSNIKSNDEIRDLSDEFNVMQGQIITYVENIKEAKNIEQAFNTEVDIASRIQLESLPAMTYFDRNIEVRAFIKPARGVGGDFYDYFYIDQDHLALLVADVSGKGIPASLFMMRSRESIRSAAMNEKDLSKVFFKVNNALCVNNKEGFFVTVFLGVLNLKTYDFKYISAGHERPYIKRNDESKRLDVESNFVLGLEEDFNYVEQKIKLMEGDSIVLYTDGLNEAINGNKEEFGYERIATSLSKDNELKENITTLISDLEQFEGQEEQFDDITIISFNIKKNVVSYDYLNPTYDDITDLTEKVETYLEDLDPIMVSKIGVVIDEVMNNIISYGKTKTNKTLSVSIERFDDGATLIFVDNSHPFNPLLKEKRTVQENMEEGIVGGLGISIVKSISKYAEYVYSNNKNILIIKF